MKRTLIILGITLFGFAGSAQAALVDVWDYTITGTFSDSQFIGDLYTEGETSLSWGQPSDSEQSKLLYIAPNPVIGQAETYMNVGSPEPFFAPSVTLSHENFPIVSGTGSLISTSLQIQVELTPEEGGTTYSDAFSFPILFYETPNAPGYPDEMDIFALNFSGFPNLDFLYEGYTYYVNIFPTNEGSFSLIPKNHIDVTKSMADNNDAYTALIYGNLGFVTPENGITNAPFAFLISSEPINNVVPEPSTLLLMGAGLLGLGYIGKRKVRKS